MGCTFFSQTHLDFLFGSLKYTSVGIGQILEADVRWYLPPLWREGLPVICAFWHVHSFYPFPHFIMIYPSQFKFPYQLALPQHPQADTQASGFALKMDHH
jgi:hypothetical protein